MKIFMLDEVYEFAKSIGIIDKINELGKKLYDPSTIQSDLQSYYNFSHSEEYAALINELETKIKDSDIKLYNLLVYSRTESYEVIVELLNSVKNLRDRFILLDRAISYRLSTSYEYELLIALFCNMYTEIREDIRAELPKYIHLAYFNYSSIHYYLNISTSGNVDIFDEYEKIMDKLYNKIKSYIKDTNTLDNLRFEVRCAALQHILPRVSMDKKLSTLEKIEELADVSKMSFDNKEKSIGVIWTFENLYSEYFNIDNYPKFFYWLYKQYKYLDKALDNKEEFFDALRYYNSNNITSFIISMRRFYLIQHLFPTFQMNFDNIHPNDRDFISADGLDYTLYDTYANKLLLEKFKTYVDNWYNINIDKLKDLANNKEMILKCKKMVVDGMSEEEADKEAKKEVYENTNNTNAGIKEEFVNPGEHIGHPESYNLSNLDTPNNVEVDPADLEKLNSYSEQDKDHTVVNTDELLKYEEKYIDTSGGNSDSKVDKPVESESNSSVSDQDTTKPPSIPKLPDGFSVNEDELNSLTEEEKAAMAAAQEE